MKGGEKEGKKGEAGERKKYLTKRNKCNITTKCYINAKYENHTKVGKTGQEEEKEGAREGEREELGKKQENSIDIS